MSFSNPTALRIGMSGVIEGMRYTVLGRVTLGMEETGERYYWNEFYLGNEEGGVVTLVFEEMETGPTWKLFKEFDPVQPLTAGEARNKRLGEVVHIDGSPARISLVDDSRVYHIEGAAPEGTEVGDIANYFNVESGRSMVVVSWTGDEVEFYKGRDLPRGQIESAFGLPPPRASGASFSQFSGQSIEWGLGSLNGRTISAVIAGAIFAILGLWSLVSNGCERDVSFAEPPPKVAAPTHALPIGVRGTLADHRYEVTGYALVEVGQVGRRFDRYEYVLKDDSGTRALLVQGLGGNMNEWHLLTPVAPPAGFTAYAAATLRSGRPVALLGHTFQVKQLFQAVPRKIEGSAAAAEWPSNLFYGFVANEKDDWLVVRWSETELRFYEGRWLPDKEVLAAMNKVQ